MGRELVLNAELGADGLRTGLAAATELSPSATERLWVRAEGLDAVALAAAVASVVDLPLGVVCELDRAPSVLARDLTTLTYLCPAGLIVALRAEPAQVEQLEEYLAVLRAMFSNEETTLQLGSSHLEAAPNRPLPVVKGGPAIWVDRRAGAEVDVDADGELVEGDLLALEAASR